MRTSTRWTAIRPASSNCAAPGASGSASKVHRRSRLWQCAIGEVEADARELPAAAMFETVKALSNAIATLRERGQLPFVEPFRLDDAGWVANRWCELLPIPLSAKYKLMALEDPAVRLSVVDGYLRDKQVVR